MSTKKSFVLRLDEDTFKALEKWAADEFRSVNGQIEWIIHRSLEQAGRGKSGKKKS
ncbi:MAG: Arc family DNA-binding protein [Flavobacteriales bacterium]|nr:Arc family DNA-binding protein [Flavobacteriales bacterium]